MIKHLELFLGTKKIPSAFAYWLISSALLAVGSPSMAAQSAVILLYHHVAENTPPSTSISPANFDAHLAYLRDNGFNVIALDRMIDSLRSGQSLPEKSVVITFDDGYSSIYNEAFPMLESYGYPFTLFLSTEPIDNGLRNYMTWDQVREMSAAGVIIANHMIDHPYMLETRDNESDDQRLARLREDLLKAEQRIETETQQSHRYLAYPYGEYDPAIKSLLQKLNFVGLAQNSGAVGPESDFLALPRFPLASIYANLDTASTKFSTLPFVVSQLRPDSPLTSNRSPSAVLKFEKGDYNFSQIGCFANSKPIPMTWIDREQGVLELTPEASYSGRRWRYICTAPDPISNRFYWHSVQWINLD
ncbi:MAG: polysaccharide deacetylase family protein [Gammaproteobacteria bacterium]|nr:polysaccharide deacetylase family protein [Gammaproteobacteria bacterium]